MAITPGSHSPSFGASLMETDKRVVVFSASVPTHSAILQELYGVMLNPMWVEPHVSGQVPVVPQKSQVP